MEEKAILIEILQRVTKVETKVDAMNNAKDIANEALLSAKSAHHRIDGVESTIKWLWGTAISTGALVVAVIGVIIKGVK